MVRGKFAALLGGVVLLYLIVTWSGSGLLPRARNIADMKLIRTMAADDGGEGQVTVTVSGNVQKDSPNGSTRPPILLTQSGQTVFGTCVRLKEDSEGVLEFGHLAECVVGEDYARAGIEELCDYLERDVSMRLETKLFVVRGETGESALRGAGSEHTAITDSLFSISQNPSFGGKYWPYTVREYVSGQEDNGLSLLPVLKLEDNPDYDPEHPTAQPEKTVRLAGLALMEEDKLTAYLTEEESQGVSLLTGNDRMDPFEVPLSDGTVAGVRLTETKCRWEPVFGPEGNLTALTARMEVKGDLDQFSGDWSEEMLQEMERGFSQQVRASAQAALDRSQKEGADFLHIRRELMCVCPLQASRLQANWDSWFPTLELKAEVKGEIMRSYDFDRPGVSDGE
ncbi:MAG: hypothetical protein IJ792_04930 [Oscillospiraceae bacterium]|nr:hypothetical protein [Oscillospiraceae bacterium]